MHHLGYVFGFRPEIPAIDGINKARVGEFYRRVLCKVKCIDKFDALKEIEKPLSEFLSNPKQQLTNFKAINMDSIMAYGLPESWVSGDIKSELKTELSEADIKLLKSRYSLKQNVFEELKIKDEIEV